MVFFFVFFFYFFFLFCFVLKMISQKCESLLQTEKKQIEKIGSDNKK